MGVFCLYFWYSILCPHLLSPISSKRLTPLTLFNKRYTKTGVNKAKYWNPDKDDKEIMVTPVQIKNSPK